MSRAAPGLLTALLLAGCAEPAPSPPSPIEENLRDFALANCLFWYFDERGWDVEDILGIAGGYVELGSSSAETYAQIAELVHGWHPDIRTKHELDVELVKCFHLTRNEELEALIREAAAEPPR